ncbi:MAG: hypothetical protein JW874_06945 [Spirochaetales bacterium]|nr:hypothetical protein [Spirochaetales bacterium]
MKKVSSSAKPAGKKAPVKKTASGTRKTAANKAVPQKQSPRDRLAAELVKMIPELDTEGLLYLVKQAGVLLHNQRIDQINAEIDEMNKTKREKHKMAGTTARVGQNVQEITVEIQQSPDRKTYYLIVDEVKHFLTDSEMAKVVRLCVKPDTKSDALRFLFQYLDTERKEILMDHGISTRKHPFFEALFYEVRAKFLINE